jgi:hypothetical protein
LQPIKRKTHNSNDDVGREINKEYSLNAPVLGGKGLKLITSNPVSLMKEQMFTTGFSYKETRLNSRNSDVVETQITTQLIGFIYVEKTINHLTGQTSTVSGLSWNFSEGVGLVVNAGIKIPLYQE